MNERQKVFIEAYLTHFNSTKAAIEAGYSEKSARKHGSYLRTNKDIDKIITERINKILAQFDDYRVKLIRFWLDIVEDEEATKSDQLRASENLAKYFKMFTDRLEVTGNNGEPIQVSWQK